MPTIDFYLMSEPSITDSYRVICRIIDKAYMQKKRVFVNASSPEEVSLLDDLLWTFRDDGFIPHEIGNKTKSPLTPILIAHGIKPESKHEILLNLCEQIPDFYDQFERVLEVVPNNDSAKKNSREKFRLYREKNCELTTHDLSTKNNG